MGTTSGGKGERRRLQRHPLRFDRNEWAGAFGDLGTDLPLLAGMILVAGLDSASVLTMFGLAQLASGLVYRLPMPVQPLKAVAALVIAGSYAPTVIAGAGLTIGIVMLGLAATGMIDRLNRWIPRVVIRGIQLGLGLKLGLLALNRFIPREGAGGILLAAVCLVAGIVLLGNRRVPRGLVIVGLGFLYAGLLRPGFRDLAIEPSLALPRPLVPSPADLAQGFLLLALPQIPLSLGNSIFATRQLLEDYFPERGITARRIAFTYSLMNITAPLLGGAPVCHGSGGLAGHYAFGGRTGGSVLIYGTMYAVAGLLFGSGFGQIVRVFPLPVLGVLLLFEGWALARLLGEYLGEPRSLGLATVVGLAAALLPYGFVLALVGGTALAYVPGLKPRGGNVCGAGQIPTGSEERG